MIKILLYLLLYVIMGVISVLTASTIHVCKAYKRGYNSYVIERMIERMMNDYKSEHSFIIGFVIGLFIWPIRIIQLIMNEKYVFEFYEEIVKESE